METRTQALRSTEDRPLPAHNANGQQGRCFAPASLRPSRPLACGLAEEDEQSEDDEASTQRGPGGPVPPCVAGLGVGFT